MLEKGKPNTAENLVRSPISLNLVEAVILIVFFIKKLAEIKVSYLRSIILGMSFLKSMMSSGFRTTPPRNSNRLNGLITIPIVLPKSFIIELSLKSTSAKSLSVSSKKISQVYRILPR